MSDLYATYADRLMGTQPIVAAHVPPEHVAAVLHGLADHTAIVAMLRDDGMDAPTRVGRWYHGLADALERARWERAPVSAPEPQVRDEAEVRRDERQRIWTEIAERRHKALRISRHETPDRAWDCIPMSALCDLLMERAQ